MPIEEKAGFSTHWQKFGQGSRKAMLIHCTLAHSGALRGVAAELGDLLDMVAFDLPSHGKSAYWDERGEVQGVVAAIAADLLDGPADIIGHSFGATVALRLAVERPDLVRSLTLIEPVAMAVAFADAPALRVAHDLATQEMNLAMERRDWSEAARVFTSSWGDGRAWEKLPPDAKERMARQMCIVEASAPVLLDDVAGHVANGDFTRVTAPTLLIEGETTLPIIRAVMAGLHARIPNSARHVVAGASHMAPMTHPADTAAAIRHFLVGTSS